MARHTLLTRERLDGTAVDIEFLLIAVIQGFALATLAVDADPIMAGGDWLYLPYLLAAFILILVFWGLAIVHSISFISWPFDLVHTLLYLLVGFVEVSSFSAIRHPEAWFFFMAGFFIVSGLLYLWDMKMIAERHAEFQDTPARARLYDHIYANQSFELRFVMAPAIVFQVAVVLVMWQAPDLVLGGNRHLLIVGAQDLFGLGFLTLIIRSFTTRRKLITNVADDDEARAAG
jgi:hypothetical protein